MAIQFIRDALCSKKRPQSLFEDRSKIVFQGPSPQTCVVRFKDEHENPDFLGLGTINNALSTLFFQNLDCLGVDHYFIKRLNMSEQLVKHIDPMPFDVCVHHLSNADLSKRLRLDPMSLLPEPLVEFRFIDGEERHPISENHLITLGHAHEEEIERIEHVAKQAFLFLAGHFYTNRIQPLSIRFRFGRLIQFEPFEHLHLLLCDAVDLNACELLDMDHEQRIDLSNTQRCWDNLTSAQEIARRFKLIQKS